MQGRLVKKEISRPFCNADWLAGPNPVHDHNPTHHQRPLTVPFSREPGLPRTLDCLLAVTNVGFLPLYRRGTSLG